MAVLFAAFGVIWGVLADSGMIIFDGIYSGISVGLSSLSVIVLKQVESGENERFPFGRAHFEPILVFFKSLVLIGTCVYSATNSFAELVGEGRYVEPDMGIVYSLISTVGCLAVAVILHVKNIQMESDIVGVERNQWVGDFILSFGVLVGFVVSFLLKGTDYSHLMPYADPLMVVIFSSIFIVMIMGSLGNPVRQLLLYRAKARGIKPIQDLVQEIAREIDARPKLHIVCVGREICVEANFLVGERAFSVVEMDEVRNRLEEKALKIRQRNRINVSFTQQEKWL